MIKKLRRKFVIINMSLVAVILCVVLGMFCFTRVHAFRAESEIAMRQMLNSSRSKEPPKNDTKPQSPSLDFGPGGRNPAACVSPGKMQKAPVTAHFRNREWMKLRKK